MQETEKCASEILRMSRIYVEVGSMPMFGFLCQLHLGRISLSVGKAYVCHPSYKKKRPTHCGETKLICIQAWQLKGDRVPNLKLQGESVDYFDIISTSLW